MMNIIRWPRKKAVSADEPKKATARLGLKGITKYLGEHQYILMVLLIFGIALFLRLWRIELIPGGFAAGEREVVDQLMSMSKGKLWLGGEFYRAAYIYPAYLLVKIFGLKIIVLRVFSAIIGSATILLSYFFIGKWFSKKIAIFAAFLFAISSFHITISRLILPEILLPLVLLALFTVLTTAYRSKNIYLFALSGALGAIGLYTSPAFLIIPILFMISGLFFFFKNRKFVTAYKKELILSVMGFLALAIPFIVSFVSYPLSYLTYFGFNRSAWQLVMNIGQIPMMLFVRADVNYFLNVGSEPLLDPFIFVAGIAGFIFALFNIQRRKYFFMIAWLVLFAVYAALKRGVQPIDLIGILPVMYAFAALILDYILVKWFETFPYNKNARILAIGLISIFFALSALYNYQRYFIAYRDSKEVKKVFSEVPPIPLR